VEKKKIKLLTQGLKQEVNLLLKRTLTAKLQKKLLHKKTLK
jgi:hypothetical protein